VEQIACNASSTSSTILSRVLTALKITSSVKTAYSRQLTANGQNCLPTPNGRVFAVR
jgi:hypothetical protein